MLSSLKYRGKGNAFFLIYNSFALEIMLYISCFFRVGITCICFCPLDCLFVFVLYKMC